MLECIDGQAAQGPIGQESVGAEITLATFGRQLWSAGKKTGVHVWPGTLED